VIVNNSTNINKMKFNHLSSEANEQQTKPLRMTLGLQVLTCGGIKSFYGTSTLCLLIIRSPTAI